MSVSNELRESAAQTARRADEKGRADEKVRETAAAAGEQAKEKGRNLISEQKDRAANQLGEWKTTLQKTSERMREDSDNNIARLLSAGAERLERFEQQVRAKEPGELVNDIQELARRRPELVYGGMVVLGLGLARLLKTVGQRHTSGLPEGRDASRPELTGRSHTVPGGSDAQPVSQRTRPGIPSAERDSASGGQVRSVTGPQI